MENGKKVKLILEKLVEGNEEFFDVTMSKLNSDGGVKKLEAIRYSDIEAATRYISTTYGKILPETAGLNLDEKRYVARRLGDEK